MCFVYDINTIFCNCRSEVCFGTKVTDIVYVSVGSSIHLGDIEKGAIINSAADFTFAARFAVFFIRTVNSLCKTFCAGGFTNSSASGEKICMAKGFFRNFLRKDGSYVFLSRNVTEKARTIFSIKRLVHIKFLLSN